MFLLKVAALWLRFYRYMYHFIREKSKGQAFLARQERWRIAEGGYSHQQATYPQSLFGNAAKCRI